MIEAVIFDWGGTLTPWKTIDFAAAWHGVAERLARDGQRFPQRVAEVAGALLRAEQRIWRRARDEHRSGTLAEVFSSAGVASTPEAYAAVYAEWEHATYADPEALEVLAGLRERGIRVGVLSNTCWPREHHEALFARDGVLELIDGAVYTCEIAWTKPHPEAFRAALAAVDAASPARCVFVGDRPFDDIYGAKQAGLRAVLVPHSDIPAEQRGHAVGTPDAPIVSLRQLLPLVDRWRDARRSDDRGRGSEPSVSGSKTTMDAAARENSSRVAATER